MSRIPRSRPWRRSRGSGSGSRLAAAAVVAAAALTVTACSGGSGAAAVTGTTGADGKVHVSVWAWYPEFQSVVDHFNETHDDIAIDWTNAGAGADEYTKLQTALKAGSGAPDVVQLEFLEVPTIQITGHLLDMGEYGANDVKDDYVSWAWSQVSDGDSVYAIPVDSGPVAVLYRTDLFEKYGLEVPTTWDEFATLAAKIKEVAPDSYITDYGASDGSWLNSLTWQAGATPVDYSYEDPTNIGLTYNDDASKKVLDYWGDLVNSGLVDTTAYGSTDYYNGLSTGKYFMSIAAGWGPGYMQSVAAKTSGLWGAAPLMQWNEGDDAQTDIGGSAFSVTDQTTHPAEASQVAREIFGTDLDAWKLGIDEAYLFPTVNDVLEWDYFATKEWEFFGGQAVNEVFIDASDGITEFSWSPFNDYVFSQYTTLLNKAITDKSSFSDILDELQTTVTDYATKQGFTVTE